MACGGCATTYVTMLTIGCPIHLINWLVINIYTIQIDFGLKLV